MRKAIQIAAVPAVSPAVPSALCALAEDGSMWLKYAGEDWRRIADLPPPSPEEEAAAKKKVLERAVNRLRK